MLRVRALRAGYYNSNWQKVGTEFFLLDLKGLKWTDEFNRGTEEVVKTAKEQFSKKWMELIEELPNPVQSTEVVEKVVYVDSETDEVISKPATKKKATKKKPAKVEIVKEDEVDSEVVIS